MKNLLLAGLVAGILMTNNIYAQHDTTLGQKMGAATKKAGKAIGKGATTVGNKTAELASKGSSAIVDKVYKDKVTASGRTVYINNHSQYYWVGKTGKKHYVKESQLKVKS